MTKTQLNMIQMHEAFGHPVRKEVAMIDPAESELACDLIQEELNELKDAITLGDVRGIIDALGDLEVVVRSAAIRYGVDLDKLVNEFIHPSNMSKLCEDEHAAKLSKERYADKGVRTYYEQCPTDPEKYVVKREIDGKFLKGPGFFEPDLDRYLELYG